MIELNQKHLEDAISELERGYVVSTIELIKIPVYKKVIEKDMNAEWVTEKRVTELQNTLDLNQKSAIWHKESVRNVEAILKKVYKLRK